MRVRFSVLIAFAALLAAAGPVSAECPFVPPVPTIGEREVRTARELLVGQVVANGPWNGQPTASDFLLRIDEVLRGDAEVGSVRHFFWVGPNWPWMKGSEESAPIPSCSTLRGMEGEVLVMAIDALAPGAWRQNGDVGWYQPPTRYTAEAILAPSGTLVSVDDPRIAGLAMTDVRALAELPRTDAAAAPKPGADAGLRTIAAAGFAAVVAMASAWPVRRRLGRPIP